LTTNSKEWTYKAIRDAILHEKQVFGKRRQAKRIASEGIPRQNDTFAWMPFNASNQAEKTREQNAKASGLSWIIGSSQKRGFTHKDEFR